MEKAEKLGQEKQYQARNQERWTAAIPTVEPSVRSTDVTEAKLTYTSHSQMSTEDFKRALRKCGVSSDVCSTPPVQQQESRIERRKETEVFREDACHMNFINKQR